MWVLVCFLVLVAVEAVVVAVVFVVVAVTGCCWCTVAGGTHYQHLSTTVYVVVFVWV